MTIDLTCYSPKKADLGVIIRKDNENVCYEVAERLYDSYYEERNGVDCKPFEPNIIYTFSNGLAFRVHDNETGNDSMTLEFGVAHAEQKLQLLAHIPNLLVETGFVNEKDEETVGKLRNFLKSQQQGIRL